MTRPALCYRDYLQVDRLLSLQALPSSMYSETMTPADFLEFRDYPFRRQASNRSSSDLIDTRLGVAEGTRLPLDGQAVESGLSCADRYRLAAIRRPDDLRPARHVTCAHAFARFYDHEADHAARRVKLLYCARKETAGIFNKQNGGLIDELGTCKCPVSESYSMTRRGMQ